MKYTSESIGSKLIETITSGLYDGNLNCLREYVQNGIDAKANNIRIYFENVNDLIISDDGSGMNEADLEMALSIGISNKSDDSIGWRGIGIWSGVPACRKIVIITKKKNNKKIRVEIDNDILRNGSTINMPFLDILEEATGEIEELPLGRNESFENDHFTEIRLESILFTQKTVFSKKEILKYLSKSVPAPFDETKFSLAKEINRWLEEKRVEIIDVNILFENKKIFRNPERDDIYFSEVTKREFRVNNELIAIGWFITSNENRTLPEPNVGIFFKKKGFTIGDSTLVEKLNPMENYTRWQYGEIHIISKDIRENAARNSFELNNPYVEPFLIEIGRYIKELQNQNRFQSDKVQTKAVSAARKHLEKGNQELALKTIEKAKDTISKARKFPMDAALQNMKERINEVSKQNMIDLAKLETEIKGTSYGGQIADSEVIASKPSAVREIAPKTIEKTTGVRSSEVLNKPATTPDTITVVPEEKIEPLLDSILKNLHPDVSAYVSSVTVPN